eukprot:GHVP01036768.1.p1 GENE.GHVP01036768.1~~GHVP01036768.1.p1  ORF type:complete len:242 (+),score=51.26 GHVP01036768.1:76-801(+)
MSNENQVDAFCDTIQDLSRKANTKNKKTLKIEYQKLAILYTDLLNQRLKLEFAIYKTTPSRLSPVDALAGHVKQIIEESETLKRNLKEYKEENNNLKQMIESFDVLKKDLKEAGEENSILKQKIQEREEEIDYKCDISVLTDKDKIRNEQTVLNSDFKKEILIENNSDEVERLKQEIKTLESRMNNKTENIDSTQNKPLDLNYLRNVFICFLNRPEKREEIIPVIADLLSISKKNKNEFSL